MATGLLARRAQSTIGETSALFRSSFSSFLRNLSTAAPINSSAAESAAEAGGEVQKPKRKKKKNLFEVAQFLPNWGIGYHMAKTHWTGVSYEITKINLYKDGRHGKAWGLVHKDGNPFPFVCVCVCILICLRFLFFRVEVDMISTSSLTFDNVARIFDIVLL
ncbi:hypothetical protein ACP275_11G125700 [Erythranthe tilingii]